MQSCPLLRAGYFTQEDPIGVAGGVNLYGYSNGDPVNFSDPFGLEPCKESTAWTDCIAQAVATLGARSGGAGGNAVVTVAALANAAMEALGINAAASAGDAIGNGRLAEGALTAAFVLGIPGGRGKAVAGTITGFTKHGLNQAISRDGVGVAGTAILDAVRQPLRTAPQARGAMKYIGANATVILNGAGEVVSTWAHNSTAWRLRP